jgi:hypothetical protein
MSRPYAHWWKRRSSHKKRGCFLIIDDEDPIRFVGRVFLEQGHGIDSVRGQEGIKMFRNMRLIS